MHSIRDTAHIGINDIDLTAMSSKVNCYEVNKKIIYMTDCVSCKLES